MLAGWPGSHLGLRRTLRQAIPCYRLCSRTVPNKPAPMSHRLGAMVWFSFSDLGLNLWKREYHTIYIL